MEDFVLQNGMAGLICALLLQWLKRAQWFTPLGTDKVFEQVNLRVSLVMAGLAAAGIHYQAHFDPHTGHYDIGLSGDMLSLTGFAWEWVKQWLTQHGAYKTVICLPELLGNINNTLLRLEVGGLGAPTIDGQIEDKRLNSPSSPSSPSNK